MLYAHNGRGQTQRCDAMQRLISVYITSVPYSLVNNRINTFRGKARITQLIGRKQINKN
jgi:hypothetical protein